MLSEEVRGPTKKATNFFKISGKRSSQQQHKDVNNHMSVQRTSMEDSP